MIDTEARLALCRQYQAAGDMKLAVQCAYEGLNVDPDDVEILKYVSLLHVQGRNFGLAYQFFLRLKELAPGDPEVEHNLGLALMNMAPIANREDKLDLAEKYFRRAIGKSNYWGSHAGLAQIALSRGEFDACISHAKNGLALQHEGSLAQTMGFALLAKSRFGEGFDAVEEHVSKSEMRKPKPCHGEPYWLGPIRDGVMRFPRDTLFVQGEQGLGDEISFASCIPDAAKDLNITLECDPRLEGLFRRSFPNVEVHGTRVNAKEPANRDWAQGRDFDAMCLSGTLCKHYRREVSDFPRMGFLVPDPERRIQWRALLDTLPGKKIGIAWNGGVPMNFKGRRSMKLKDLDFLLKTPGVTWVSLEYKDPTDDIAEYKAKSGIEIKHWPRAGEADDYDETAALVCELDAVISVCTAVVHLCGALDKTCHVLVPKAPRWFYGAEGRDHPWYRSLILHRKTKEWPLDEVKRELLDELWPAMAAAD